MNRTKLLQFLQDNKRPFTPIEARVVAKGRDAAIYLYDPIVGDKATAEWWGGICPQDFVPAVRALDAENITIYTNCPGGDVFAAEAMCQALREHPAKVTMQIEGYAASAATSIACACDEVVATKGSKYMIHQTWTIALGNADDFDSVAALLRQCDGSMYDEYVQKTGKERDQIEAWCKAETWFTAEEAKAAGFIDQVLDTVKASADGRKWNLSAYANAPKTEREPTPTPDPQPEPEPAIAYASTEHRERQQQRMSMLARLTSQ